MTIGFLLGCRVDLRWSDQRKNGSDGMMCFLIDTDETDNLDGIGLHRESCVINDKDIPPSYESDNRD
jgi:hypothetical protein